MKMSILLTDRYASIISGELGCYDRIIIRGTPGNTGYAAGMTSFFYANNYKIFDFTKIFTPVTTAIKSNLEQLAKEHNIEIEYVRKVGAFRKEDKINELIANSGNQPGLVHIFSQLEVLTTFDPWHDKNSKRQYHCERYS